MFDSLYGGLESAGKANSKKHVADDNMFADLPEKKEELEVQGPVGPPPAPKEDSQRAASAEKTSGATNPAVMAFAASKLMAPPMRKKADTGKKPAPVIDIAALQAEKEALLQKKEAQISAPVEIHGPSPTTTVSRMAAAPEQEDEEYDPTKPNDYDEYCRRRMRQKAEEEIEKRRQADAERRKAAAMSKPEAPKEDDFATKMLKKMGWKEGEGLGKEGQGMSAPLVMQKTDTATGKIVEGAKRPVPAQTAPVQDAKKPKTGAAGFNRPPTRVLLLQNLVGKGEVDDDLESETAEEAGKYGKVVKSKIKE